MRFTTLQILFLFPGLDSVCTEEIIARVLHVERISAQFSVRDAFFLNFLATPGKGLTFL